MGIVDNPVTGRAEEASDPRRAIYRPMMQGLGGNASGVDGIPFYTMLEVTNAPESYQQALKVAAQNVNRDVPIVLIKPLTQVLEESVCRI